MIDDAGAESPKDDLPESVPAPKTAWQRRDPEPQPKGRRMHTGGADPRVDALMQQMACLTQMRDLASGMLLLTQSTKATSRTIRHRLRLSGVAPLESPARRLQIGGRGMPCLMAEVLPLLRLRGGFFCNLMMIVHCAMSLRHRHCSHSLLTRHVLP